MWATAASTVRYVGILYCAERCLAESLSVDQQCTLLEGCKGRRCFLQLLKCLNLEFASAVDQATTLISKLEGLLQSIANTSSPI